jgi:hypothetical protein
MEYTYTIDSKKNLIHIKYTGMVKYDDSLSSINKITSDPNFTIGMSVLIDLTDAEINWSLTDMDKLRALVKSRNAIGARKWAMVASSGITQMNARLFSVLNEAFEDSLTVRLFSRTEDALEWINKSG